MAEDCGTRDDFQRGNGAKCILAYFHSLWLLPFLHGTSVFLSS